LSQDSEGFEPYGDTPALLDYLDGRFGLEPMLFAEHRFWQRTGSPAIFIAHARCRPVRGVATDVLGLLALRDPPPRGYPTTAFLMRFGMQATRNVYAIDTDTALRLLRDGAIPHLDPETPKGPWIVRTDHAVVGRAWVRDGQLVGEIPKSVSMRLRGG
jgi:hypothetical protein